MLPDLCGPIYAGGAAGVGVSVGVPFASGKVPRDLGERLELSVGDRAKHDFFAMLLNEDFRTREPECLGQPYGLTTAMLKDLCCGHSYVLYLYIR